jgi:hypothetical protein
MASVVAHSKEHRDLLDTIDKLRSIGLSKYIDLPQLVVCGDQSAGKSSVLEAISRMSFPTKDGLCTRFATELVLRRDNKTGVIVSIIPGPKRTPEERAMLEKFSIKVDQGCPDLGSVVEKAGLAMGVGDDKGFSEDTLRVEVMGPEQQHLTLVDLPGLFRATTKTQAFNDPNMVKDMVISHMKQPRSVILAIISAKSDFAVQEVTAIARLVDPCGSRTMAIVTKPDFLDAGSPSEEHYLKLMQNEEVHFQLGWHMLKNRGYGERDATSAQRDAAEEAFFSKGVWVNLDPLQLGVKHLKTKLSNTLMNQIIAQLPGLVQEIRAGIADSKDKLQLLGPSRADLEAQRYHLGQMSHRFTALIRAALDATYSDSFFGDALTQEGREKRLRSVMKLHLTEFANYMEQQGQKRVIVDLADGEDLQKGQVLRSKYVEEVSELMNRTGGRELPGLFDPMIIQVLFLEQCEPWQVFVDILHHKVVQAVRETVSYIIGHIAGDNAPQELYDFVGEQIDELGQKLKDKLKELIDGQFESHPITHNPELVRSVEHAQAERFRKQLESLLEDCTTDRDMRTGRTMAALTTLIPQIARKQGNLSLRGSETALDYMEAYYEVNRLPSEVVQTIY